MGDDTGNDIDTEKQGRPSKRQAPPDWLIAQFQQKIEECHDRDAQGLPPLYRNLRTFWFPTPSSFFLLRQIHVTPQSLFKARFFLWDPEPLCHGGIACPNCSTKLCRHGHIHIPRRCVDLDGQFWIIGFRYYCPNCKPNLSPGLTATFQSWDNRILAVLPHELSAEFPACLSHRSGMSASVFKFMRSCFQNGMGAKQFSDALRVQHLEMYDELTLQYLNYLAHQQSILGMQGEKYEAFLPYDDYSSKGPHGFVPSSQWL